MSATNQLVINLINVNKKIEAIEARQRNLEKRVNDLEKEGSYFDRAENIKEVRNLNGR